MLKKIIIATIAVAVIALAIVGFYVVALTLFLMHSGGLLHL